MDEKIQNLYYSYLKPKLDLVFDFNVDKEQSITIGPSRFGRTKPTPPVLRVVGEEYGPHGDYTKYHLYQDDVEIDESISEVFEKLGWGYYRLSREIRKNGEKVGSLPPYSTAEVLQSEDGISILLINRHLEYDQDVPDRYIIFNENDSLCERTWFNYAYTIGYGYTIIETKGNFNVLDRTGKLIFKKWTKSLENISYNDCFITLEDETFPIRREFLGYKVDKKIIGNKHTIDDGITKYTVEFTPVRIYDVRFSLGYRKNKLYIYDRFLNTYKEIGLTSNFEFSEKDPFIIDKRNEIAYMIYENQILDISRYYKEYLSNGTPFKINDGVPVMNFDTFSSKRFEDIEKIIKEEAKNNTKLKLDIEEQKKQKELQEERLRKEQEEKELDELESKAIKQIQEGYNMLHMVQQKRALKKKLPLDSSLFIVYQDHIEFSPDIISNLKMYNLNLEGLEQIKMDNIDFSYTNLSFNPQTVYNRTLRNSNFEGVHISPWWNFDGIDIRGCRFSEDKDIRTIDYLNSSFVKAIYDETTTYNGIPLTMLIPKENKDEEETKGAPNI